MIKKPGKGLDQAPEAHPAEDAESDVWRRPTPAEGSPADLNATVTLSQEALAELIEKVKRGRQSLPTRQQPGQQQAQGAPEVEDGEQVEEDPDDAPTVDDKDRG